MVTSVSLELPIIWVTYPPLTWQNRCRISHNNEHRMDMSTIVANSPWNFLSLLSFYHFYHFYYHFYHFYHFITYHFYHFITYHFITFMITFIILSLYHFKFKSFEMRSHYFVFPDLPTLAHPASSPPHQKQKILINFKCICS